MAFPERKEYKESSLYFAISVVSAHVMSRPLRVSYRGAVCCDRTEGNSMVSEPSVPTQYEEDVHR